MARSIHTSHRLIALLAGGIYLFLVLLVAVLPAMAQKVGPEEPWSEQVARGRQVYLSYGCVSCHTQQIRGDERKKRKLPDGTVVVEVIRPDRIFGLDEASRAEDYASDDPPFLGTERTGPDLSTVGTRLPSHLWHYWHLYKPSAVSPDTVMPGLPWLFTTEDVTDKGGEKLEEVPAALGVEGDLYAKPEAVDLVEYLLSLERRQTGR